MPPPSPRKYWTRREIAEWLVERLAEDAPALVGVDHGFSFRCAISRCTASSAIGRELIDKDRIADIASSEIFPRF
jgi:hypothetical protein